MVNIDKQIITELYEKEPFLTSAGIFYGFPICCISSFIDNYGNKRKLKSDIASYGTGYIPCESCEIKVVDNWNEVLNNIKNSRVSKLEFPLDNNQQELNYFFIYLTEYLGLNPYEQAIQLRMNDDILSILKGDTNDRKTKTCNY